MPTLVFAHSPLTPAWTWNSAAALAGQAGFAARTPNLAEAALDPLYGQSPFLPRCAEAIALAARGCADPVLIGHSAAGLLLPLAAARTYPPLGVVFVDALLPQPGKSWFDTAPAALAARVRATAVDRMARRWSDWFAPGVIEALLPERDLRARFTADCPRLPLRLFEEPAPYAQMGSVACAYLRLSETYEPEARAAEALGWIVRRASLDHLAMVTQPHLVAGMVIEIAAALPAPVEA